MTRFYRQLAAMLLLGVLIYPVPASAQDTSPFPLVADLAVPELVGSPTQFVGSTAISADGSTLAYTLWKVEGEDETFSDLVLVDIESGERRILPNASDRWIGVQQQSLSADGSEVAFSNDDQTWIWNGVAEPELVGPVDKALVTVSNDRATVVSNSMGLVTAYEAETGLEIVSFSGNGYLLTDSELVLLPTSSVDKVRVLDLDELVIVAEYELSKACEMELLVCNSLLAEWLDEPEDATLGERFSELTIRTSPKAGLFAEQLDHDTVLIYDVSTGFEIQYAASLDQLIGATDYEATDADVLRLYQAYFARTPDLGGAKYWILEVLRGGFTVEQIAGFMSDSQEFENNYAGTNNQEYMNAVYTNVLGRNADEEGFAYWLDLLNTDQLDRSGVVYWIAQNAEFKLAHPFGVRPHHTN